MVRAPQFGYLAALCLVAMSSTTAASTVGGNLPSSRAPALDEAWPLRAARGSNFQASFQSLHSFDCVADGAGPQANLITVNGALYGTTTGINRNSESSGTIFRITASGQETVVYRFKGGSDGSSPMGLLAFRGLLYAVTRYGGASDRGTVFSITPSGKKTLLYSFKNDGIDGIYPEAALIALTGAFYGVTENGGLSSVAAIDRYGGFGTVFRVSTSGSESVVHSFSTSRGGENPMGGLLVTDGVLYGTTSNGGLYDGGTVFKLRSDGAGAILANFNGGDSYGPEASLIEVNGNYYGTTVSRNRQGSVFKMNRFGHVTTLIDFNGVDGADPEGPLLFANGELYGTTVTGGEDGSGNIFALKLSGKEEVLYTFTGGADGAAPESGLTALNGKFYGTTIEGGGYGCGTVFEIDPRPGRFRG